MWLSTAASWICLRHCSRLTVPAARELAIQCRLVHLAEPFWECSSPRRRDASCSPITTQGAMVLPVETRGTIDASAMRRRSTP
jgi:hypothetical protein